MPILPFHNYIGPGNKLDNGKPVDHDDGIAQLHDTLYDEAKTPQDIVKADVETIQKFRKDWSERGNWHSLIGDVGLSLKVYVESYTGVLYPKLPNEGTASDSTDTSSLGETRCRKNYFVEEREDEFFVFHF